MFIASVVSRIQAEDMLSKAKGPLSPKRKMIKIELIHLPIYVFTLKLEDKKGRLFTEKISIDGIKGEFAFFNEVDYDASAPDIQNKFNFTITEKKARNIAVREYQRFLFKDNLKTRNDAKIINIKPGQKLYYPYWIGYFKRKRAYDFNLIDAVGGGKQGIKMRPVFMDLLLQSSHK